MSWLCNNVILHCRSVIKRCKITILRYIYFILFDVAITMLFVNICRQVVAITYRYLFSWYYLSVTNTHRDFGKIRCVLFTMRLFLDRSLCERTILILVSYEMIYIMQSHGSLDVSMILGNIWINQSFRSMARAVGRDRAAPHTCCYYCCWFW